MIPNKQKIIDALNADEIRENSARVLLTIKTSSGVRTRFKFKPFLPFYYRCPFDSTGACSDSHRTKTIIEMGEEFFLNELPFIENSIVVMEEGKNRLIMFCITSIDPPSFSRLNLTINDGRKCAINGDCSCTPHRRVTYMKFIESITEGFHPVQFL